MFLSVNFALIEIELNSPSIHFRDTKLSRLARLASLIRLTFQKMSYCKTCPVGLLFA